MVLKKLQNETSLQTRKLSGGRESVYIHFFIILLVATLILIALVGSVVGSCLTAFAAGLSSLL